LAGQARSMQGVKPLQKPLQPSALLSCTMASHVLLCCNCRRQLSIGPASGRAEKKWRGVHVLVLALREVGGLRLDARLDHVEGEGADPVADTTNSASSEHGSRRQLLLARSTVIAGELRARTRRCQCTAPTVAVGESAAPFGACTRNRQSRQRWRECS
jgi:hypothetical protein